MTEIVIISVFLGPQLQGNMSSVMNRMSSDKTKVIRTNIPGIYPQNIATLLELNLYCNSPRLLLCHDGIWDVGE